jgi:DNA-binding NtrC family response regulator
MQSLLEQVARIAVTNASVVIVGEPGTGKESVAKCIHDLSPRSREPFISVHCAAIPAGLIDAELFGHERGSFNGATQAHAGYIERAAGGTLLLDEIAEMPAEMQLKLLQVLESGRMRRLGSDRDIEVRCRIVAATQSDPRQAAAQGRLRADLLYRIGVFPLFVPPLRDRDDDAELLASYFLAELNTEEGTHKRMSPASLSALRQHPWPGNVRELRNAVHRAFILAESELDLGSVIDKLSSPSSPRDAAVLRIPVGTNLADAERWMIVATLKKCGGNKTRAAALLGVSLKTLYNRLNAYRAEGRDMSDIDAELTEVSE